MAINDTTEKNYLNIIFVEHFNTIGAATEANNLYLIRVEDFIAISCTAKASYIGVIKEERFNNNGETTEKNIVCIDDFLNSRFCGVTFLRTITARGGVKYNLIELRTLWLKDKEAAATKQRQLWRQSST